MSPVRKLSHWAALIYLVLVWGSSFALTKIAVDSVPPTWVMAGRIVLAAAILSAVLFVGGGALPRGARNWAWLLGLGLIGNVVPFVLIAWGTKFIPSSVAGILMATNPLLVLALVRLWLPDEPVRPRHLVGFAMGLGGVVALIGPAELLGIRLGGIELLAQLAVLGAAMCYALLNVTARLAPAMGLTAKSAGVMAAAAPVAGGAALFDDPAGLAAAEPEALAAIAALAVLPTALATLVLFWLVAQAGSRFVATSNYLVPPCAVAIGFVFLSERLDAGDWIGLALILVGILLSEGRMPLRLRRARLR
jgi:drug/metabolite transporter (DMT)-like permease